MSGVHCVEVRHVICAGRRCRQPGFVALRKDFG